MASSGTIGKFNTGGNDYLIASTAFATCSTGADTAAKVATIQDSASFTLITGITINVKFTYANTTSAPTLNVNSTGALTIIGAKRWDAGSVVSFTYDGTNWIQTDVGAELFECTIGTTTYAQITSALSAGQIPYLNPGGYAGIAWLSAHDDDVLGFENYEFTGYYLGNTMYTVTCWSDTTKGTNGWEANEQYFIGTTVIDENSTNDQIPTALAVYNALSSFSSGTQVIIRDWSDS